MVCYICDKPASGQCRECRRCFCRTHLGGELGCSECFASLIRDNDAKGRIEDAAREEAERPLPVGKRIGPAIVVGVCLLGLYSCSRVAGGDFMGFAIVGMVFWGIVGFLFLGIVIKGK